MAKKRGSSKTSTGSLSPSVKTSTKKATKPKKKIAYKQEYIKLLEKTNKTFIKELKAIRKAIEVPSPSTSPSKYPADFEPFPKEETKRIIPTRKVKAGSIQEQILQELEELNQQVRARDIMFDELVNSPASLRGDYFNG